MPYAMLKTQIRGYPLGSGLDADLDHALTRARGSRLQALAYALRRCISPSLRRTSLEGERSNSRSLNTSLTRDGGEIARLKAEVEKEKTKREADVAKERRSQETVKR